MVNFTVEQLRSLMDRQRNIRNMCIVAHVDHGKSTLADCLIRKAGISTKDRYTQTKEEEQDRGISIKSTGVSMFFELPKDDLPPASDGASFLVNLVDTPGHVDFSGEVTAALRVTDGALVVVDCVEGVCIQTETVLRQALNELIKPVLMINKMDRMIAELQKDPEECYLDFVKTIAVVNSCISNYNPECTAMGDIFVDPAKGSVAFGSGRDGWGFTLRTFAKLYAPKWNKSVDSLMELLWGDHWVDDETNKIVLTSRSASGKPLKRSFVQFVLEPVFRLFRLATSDDLPELEKKLAALNITLKGAEREKRGKELMQCALSKFIPAADALLEMVVAHLPAPTQAQAYRALNLYEGPMDDECGQAILRCDPEGPVMMYVSKMVFADGIFYAFGRVFSGTLRSGQRVRILGPDFTPGSKGDLYENKALQRLCIMMGRYVEAVDDCPCGNTVGLMGVDQYLNKTGTITTSPVAHNMRHMKFAVAPVVRVAVKPKNAVDIAKMAEGMRKLQKNDPTAKCTVEPETGEYIVAATGELHMEICLKDLTSFAKVEIIASPPMVSYRETVTATSSQLCLAKSGNKHNRIYLSAAPLGEALTKDIESKAVNPAGEAKERARILAEQHGWDLGEAKKLWCFGPFGVGANTLVDMSKGLQNLGAIRDSLVNTFQETTRFGVLCEEDMRGIRFNVHDATIHQDNAHRGPAQITPMMRRAMHAAQLTAVPRLLEPVYLVEIHVPRDACGGAYSVINRRRGRVNSETLTGHGLAVLRCYLPVAESFHFSEELRSATSGKAYPYLMFDHWAVLPSDPLEKNSKAEQLVLSIRKRKGLKEEIPPLASCLDRL